MDDDFEGFDGGDDAVIDDRNAFGEDFADAGEDTNDKLRLQAATHYFIGKICDNEGKQRNAPKYQVKWISFICNFFWHSIAWVITNFIFLIF